MNKKIIALLIGVFYLMSSFTFVAGAQDVTFDNDTDLTKELAVINSVNPDYILPETEAKGEEEEILGFTRGQFVKLLVDVMCVQNATEADTGYDDVDDTADYAPAVKFAKDFGIISPAENFYPDSYVTYTQATKMIVTSLGYKPLADAKGGYPTGYITVANSLDLFNDVENGGDKPLTFKDGLKLVCNMFDCVVLVQTGFGDDYIYDASDRKTFLDYYHKIKTVYGIVNANEYKYFFSWQTSVKGR